MITVYNKVGKALNKTEVGELVKEIVATKLKEREETGIRFEKCCEIGSYEHQIPMPIKGRVRGIDYCIADIVAALNAANIITTASCCGHGKMDAVIWLEDGREIIIKNTKMWV